MKLLLKNDRHSTYPEFIDPEDSGSGGFCVEHMVKRFGLRKNAAAVEVTIRRSMCLARLHKGFAEVRYEKALGRPGGQLHFIAGGGREYITRLGVEYLDRIGITPGIYFIRVREVAL